MFGPESHGKLVTPGEFDHGDYDDCWRYELINGILVVSEFSPYAVADMNDQLGCCLRNYRDNHPTALEATLPGRMVNLGDDRRIIDRAIWAGQGRLPRRCEIPAIIVDFAYERDDNREYEIRRGGFQALMVQEYWTIDRFERTMTAHILVGSKYRKKVVSATQTYRSKLLPGFELPLARLFALADEWSDDEQEGEA
jgi:Uma2 family endonuclease